MGRAGAERKGGPRLRGQQEGAGLHTGWFPGGCRERSEGRADELPRTPTWGQGFVPHAEGHELAGFRLWRGMSKDRGLGRAPLLWGLPLTAPHYTLGTQTQ